jgi:hypothetical protein
MPTIAAQLAGDERWRSRSSAAASSGSLSLTGDRRFGNLDDFIAREELRALSDQYKRIAGYSIEELAAAPGAS